MDTKNLLGILAIFAVALAVANISVTLMRGSEFKEKITGYVTGEVNLSVATQISINMSNNSVTWGSGVLNDTLENRFNATLYTVGDSQAIVRRGNWTATATALYLENIGNINASLTLTSGKNSTDLFASQSDTNQEYMWNITEKSPASCNNVTDASGGWGIWADVNKTDGGTKFCDHLDYATGKNGLYIDILLTVPYDAVNTGALGDTITATADTAG